MRLEPQDTPLIESQGDAGDMYYDGSTNTLKVHNGT